MSGAADTAVPIVSVRAASCTLGGRKVLDDVSLDVMRGEVVVLIGPSGAGKTTLLRSLNYLEEVDSGEVLIGGVSIGHRDTANKRRSAQPNWLDVVVRSVSSSSISTCSHT